MPFIPTPEQEAVLAHDPGRHARILAGPGTGKSATVVALIERLLAGNPRPRIKLLTFTRAATAELANKVADHPTAATERPSTVHSFAISLLLRNPGAGGFPKPLRIADQWEEDSIIHATLARRTGVTKSFLKKQLIPEMASGWERLDPVRFATVDAPTRARFVGAWHEHRDVYGYTLLAELPYALREALRDHPEFAGLDYDLLIVDEYQDLNACDLEILRQASDRGCTIIGTGDDDQSIYGFRWAAPEGIRRFLNDYENAADYPLSVTQRCGRRIIMWANYVIQGDPDRDPERPELTSADGSPEGDVSLLSFADESSEARGVAALVNGLIQHERIPPGEILVLLRSDHNRQFSSPIRRELSRLDIQSFDPNTVKALLEEDNNRRTLEILRLASRRDDPIAWAALLNLTRGIGGSFSDYIYNRSSGARIQFGQALLQAHEEGFPGANQAVVRRVNEMMNAVSGWLDDHPVPDAIDGGWGRWITENTGGDVVPPPSDELADLLLRLDDVAEEGQDLARYLGQIQPLGKDLMQTECDGVRIMGMTTSKGLTVTATIIAGVEEGVIPRPSADLAEERRLMYVAMTRAKRYVYCTWARQRSGPTARVGAARVGMRQRSSFLAGGPVDSQDGVRFIRDRFA